MGPACLRWTRGTGVEPQELDVWQWKWLAKATQTLNLLLEPLPEAETPVPLKLRTRSEGRRVSFQEPLEDQSPERRPVGRRNRRSLLRGRLHGYEGRQ